MRHSINIKQKQNNPYACQPRASLKMSMTTKKKPQKSQGRMSMLPLKKQRLSLAVQSQLTQSRPSLRTNINLLNTQSNTQSLMNSCQRSIRKQTIINNLVNKLDQEEEIRSIIETKLRRNSYGPNKQFMYTSEFQPYSSNTSLQTSQKNLANQLHHLMQRGNTSDISQFDENNVSILGSKLKQCQQQLDYFKSIVNDMSKKMKIMQRQQLNGSKVKNSFQKKIGLNEQSLNEQRIKCSNCGYCKCGQALLKMTPFKKVAQSKLINAQTQTGSELLQNSESYKVEQTQNYEFDFFDNLDKTLKILNNSKHL